MISTLYLRNFREAVCSGDVDKVRTIFAENPSLVEVVDELQYAVHSCRLEIVQCLVEEFGVDIESNAQNWLSCASSANVHILRYLFQHPNYKATGTLNEPICSILLFLAMRSMLPADVLQCLLWDARISLNLNITDWQGWSMLMFLAQDGMHQEIRVLLDSLDACHHELNLMLETKKPEGAAATFAAVRGHMEVVQVLHELGGVDFEYRDSRGMTILLRAAEAGHVDVVRELVFSCMVDAGAVDKEGCNAVKYAARRGQCDMLRFLVHECGVDVDNRDKNGWTALMYAADIKFQPQVVQCLVLDCGADVDSPDNYGRTALMMAADRGSMDIAQCLVQVCGATVHCQTKRGYTALMAAASENHSRLVRWLVLSAGAEVDAVDSNGQTALMLAVEYGHMNTVRCLLDECFANCYLEDADGYSAIEIAKMSGREELVSWLQGREAEIRSGGG